MQDKPESFHHQCKQSLASRGQLVHSQELHQQTIQLNHIAFETHTCQQDFISTKQHEIQFLKNTTNHILSTLTHIPRAISTFDS